MTVRLRFAIKTQPLTQLAEGVAERAANLGPVISTWPEIVRQGPGSFAEQIASREGETLSGARFPWLEPSYASGSLPERVAQGEDLLSAAFLGTGAAAITRTTATSVTLGVDDLAYRTEVAALGNGIVSSANYAGFITGNLGERTAPELAYGVKPARVRPPSTSPAARRRKPRPGDHSQVRFALWWFLGLTYGYWTTADRFYRGFEVPPHVVALSGRVVDRLRRSVAEYILGVFSYRLRKAA